MKRINMAVINEQALVGTINGVAQSLLTIVDITPHPCIIIHKESKQRVLGDRGVKAIEYREIPLIGYVQPKLIECSHI